MLVAEMHTPLLCAKQAAIIMKGVGGSVVFVANAGDRGLTDGAGNLGAISALTASAAAAGGPEGIRVNGVSHALGSQEESGGDNSNGGHGTFSLATMRAPSAEDVAMQVKAHDGDVCLAEWAFGIDRWRLDRNFVVWESGPIWKRNHRGTKVL